MAAKKNSQAVVEQSSKKMLHIGADGTLKDADKKTIAYIDLEEVGIEMAQRIVFSVNALLGYSLDEIQRGAFHGGTNIMGGDGFNVVTHNGFSVQG